MGHRQTVRPNSDITVGGYTPTPIWQNCDSTSDAEFITSPLLTIPKACEMGLTTGDGAENGDPGIDAPTKSVDFQYRIRVSKDVAGGQAVTCDMELYEGATQRASRTGLDADTTAWQTHTDTLSDAEIASIVDWSDLRIRVTGIGDLGLPRRKLRISFVEFRYPIYMGQTRVRGISIGPGKATIYDATLH